MYARANRILVHRFPTVSIRSRCSAAAIRAWDARQYVIEDPNGYHLKIAEPLDVDEEADEAVA